MGWILVCCVVCSVVSGLCDHLISCSEDFYRIVCVCVCAVCVSVGAVCVCVCAVCVCVCACSCLCFCGLKT